MRTVFFLFLQVAVVASVSTDKPRQLAHWPNLDDLIPDIPGADVLQKGLDGVKEMVNTVSGKAEEAFQLATKFNEDMKKKATRLHDTAKTIAESNNTRSLSELISQMREVSDVGKESFDSIEDSLSKGQAAISKQLEALPEALPFRASFKQIEGKFQNISSDMQDTVKDSLVPMIDAIETAQKNANLTEAQARETLQTAAGHLRSYQQKTVAWLEPVLAYEASTEDLISKFPVPDNIKEIGRNFLEKSFKSLSLIQEALNNTMTEADAAYSLVGMDVQSGALQSSPRLFSLCILAAVSWINLM